MSTCVRVRVRARACVCVCVCANQCDRVPTPNIAVNALAHVVQWISRPASPASMGTDRTVKVPVKAPCELNVWLRPIACMRYPSHSHTPISLAARKERVSLRPFHTYSSRHRTRGRQGSREHVYQSERRKFRPIRASKSHRRRANHSKDIIWIAAV